MNKEQLNMNKEDEETSGYLYFQREVAPVPGHRPSSE